jgi:hypothetical protein
MDINPFSDQPEQSVTPRAVHPEVAKAAGIAERLKLDLTMAISANQVFAPPSRDRTILDVVNAGAAGFAFDLIRHSVLLSEAMALMRLWDTRADVASIPVLDRMLRDDSFRRLVEGSRVDRQQTSIDTLLGPGVVRTTNSASGKRSVSEQITSCLSMIDAVVRSVPLARLKRFRDEIAAHAAQPVPTAQTADAAARKSVVEMPFYGDETKLLEDTVPIVAALYEILTGSAHDFDSTVYVWSKSQSDWWDLVRSITYRPPSLGPSDLFRTSVKGKLKVEF